MADHMDAAIKNSKSPLPTTVFSDGIRKIVFSHPVKKGDDGVKYIRAVIERSGDMFQASMYTKKQVFHNNFHANELRPVIDGLFGVDFMQYHAWDGEYEYSAKVSKKGKILTSRTKTTNQPRMTNYAQGSFNRVKNHIITEGDFIPALVDMGVFTKEGKVVTAMRDKFNQINRFLELLADETGPDAVPEGTTVNIVDFGCGKSYLTFLVYHYFTEIRKLRVNICGMDLDAHVVQSCTAAAKKYGYTSIKFLQGDIGQQTAPPIKLWGRGGTYNIVISLHACDTATDYALFNAVNWKADLICAAPCCQHELKKQMKPNNLTLFSGYGIIKERIAALATDAIRASLLEYCGYKTQVIEFIDMEHTSKNLLIRARRKAEKGSAAAWDEVQNVIKEFAFKPTFLRLLQEDGVLS